MSMLSTMAHALSEGMVEYADAPDLAAPDAELYGLSARYCLYRASEGWVFLAAPADERLARARGRARASRRSARRRRRARRRARGAVRVASGGRVGARAHRARRRVRRGVDRPTRRHPVQRPRQVAGVRRRNDARDDRRLPAGLAHGRVLAIGWRGRSGPALRRSTPTPCSPSSGTPPTASTRSERPVSWVRAVTVSEASGRRRSSAARCAAPRAENERRQLAARSHARSSASVTRRGASAASTPTKGHLRLVVEAITNACEDAGISPKDIDGYSSYASSIEPAELFAAFGAERLRYSSQTWGGGGGPMAGAFLNAAMAVATDQANYVVVHKVMTMEGNNRYGQAFAQMGQRARVIPGAMAFSVPYGLQSPGQMFALAGAPPHGEVRHHDRPLRRSGDQRPAHGGRTIPRRGSASRSRSRIITRAR